MGKWFRLALLIARHLIAMGSSLAGATCETSQVLLAGGPVGFLGDVSISLHLANDSA